MTPATMMTHLTRLDACGDARLWARRKSGATIWATCKRGDWLLWLAARSGVDRRQIVLAACACARTALRHVRAGEKRPRIAIETAERWARGEAGVTLVDVRYAADAADAYAAYAAHAAAAAAYAAADADAYAAAAYAADAAAADAYAYAAAADAARGSASAECADLIRAQIPWAVVEAALGEEPTDDR